MRLRKLTVSILLAAVVVIQSICLGWSIAEDDKLNITVYSLHVAFALYALVLSGTSINQTYSAHSNSIVHLCILTFVATFLLGTTAILPSTPFPGTGASLLSLAGAPLALWYAVLVLYAVCLFIVITTPRGPRLHFPSEHIYSEKTLMQITSKYEDNVCGITGASVWDVLLFSYTTKVVMLGNISESLEIGDLPIVAADMRATTIYARMRAAVRRWKLRIGTWRPKPGSGIELAYRIVRVNAATMVLIVCLASISATMFYIPAFFLQRVVRYLEVDPGRESRGWGFVFCIGLFASNALTQICEYYALLSLVSN